MCRPRALGCDSQGTKRCRLGVHGGLEVSDTLVQGRTVDDRDMFGRSKWKLGLACTACTPGLDMYETNETRNKNNTQGAGSVGASAWKQHKQEVRRLESARDVRNCSPRRPGDARGSTPRVLYSAQVKDNSTIRQATLLYKCTSVQESHSKVILKKLAGQHGCCSQLGCFRSFCAVMNPP